MTTKTDTRLNDKDYLVILDVLNMFCPDDVPDFCPGMKTQQFMDEVGETFRKVLKICEENGQVKQPQLIAKTPQGDPWIWKE